MYTEFYRLNEKPFKLTPSSRSLYLGGIHKEALAHLTYGVIERKGFILLTGEVGTGKTTMIHAMLTSLGKDIQYVYLLNPLFSANDLMNSLSFSAFKEKIFFKNKTDFLINFEGFLKRQSKEGQIFNLIIDEAQKLSHDLLEEIRLLSNMETSEEKLMNIFLVGQPELNELLNQPVCRPLLQRISIRLHIKELDEAASLEYISTKLRLSGAENPDSVIPRDVAHAIYRYSGGYPRMINILSDNILLLGYARGKRRITTSMVKECYDDLRLEGTLFDTINKKENRESKNRGLWGMARYFKWATL